MDAVAAVRAALLRGSIWSLAAKAGGAVAAFGLQILLARVLSIGEYGVVSYLLAWVSMMAVIGCLGLDKAALRFVPQYEADGNPDKAGAYVAWAVRIVLTTSLASGVVLFVLALVRVDIRDLSWATAALAFLLVPLFSLSQLYGEVVRAYHRVVLSELPAMIGRPTAAAICIIVAVMLGFRQSVVSVMTVMVGASAFALGALWLVQRSLVPAQGNHGPSLPNAAVSSREWLAVAIPLLLVTSSNFVLARIDVVMLGAIAGPEEAGGYNAASRLAALVGFPGVAIAAVLTPMLARLSGQGRADDLRRLVFMAAVLMTVAAALPGAACIAFAAALLGMFGPDYVAQVATTNILVASQIACAVAGPAGYILAMTGHQARLARATLGSALLNVALNWLLIPRYGSAGAAAATAASLVIHNVVTSLVSIRMCGVNPTVLPLPPAWLASGVDRGKV